jgi:VanZ family protein
MNWLIYHYRSLTRALAWLGLLAIIGLSVVPAVDRPVTGAGQWFEHFAAYALVAGAFAVGYSFSLARLILCAFVFCGGIELLQVPLPTRHARVSDFVVDLIGSCIAIGFVVASEKLFGVGDSRSRQMCRRDG